MSAPDNVCASCSYFDSTNDANVCRINPPSMFVVKALWPKIDHPMTDWCGDYKAVEAPQ